MKNVKHVTPANGNVFADLGLPEAENLKIRADLMAEIAKRVKKSGMTQQAAARQLKTTQPRLNDVLKGRIGKCTIDRLVNMLAAIDVRVSLRVKKAA